MHRVTAIGVHATIEWCCRRVPLTATGGGHAFDATFGDHGDALNFIGQSRVGITGWVIVLAQQNLPDNALKVLRTGLYTSGVEGTEGRVLRRN